MNLFLCEKPSQGKDIAKVLVATKRGDGFLSSADGQTVVTWGIGHLVEQFNPDEYDPAWKKWAFETLPIIPGQWQLSPKNETKKQYNVVIKLIKQARLVIIATDIDREGEMIARELLDIAGYRGAIKRLWLSALDDASIRQGLAKLKDGEETLSLYYAGLARSRADWLIGMNFSRLFTLLAQQKGYQGKRLSVGRVQSPTLSLVVNRDREIKHFTPKQHFTLQFTLSEGQHRFVADYCIPEQYCDDDGLCLDASVINSANQQIRQLGTAKVVSADTKREKQNAPLLFALSDLQSEANRLYGMGAQEVLDIAQSLYETHKATTYPRTDCGYLPESQLAEAPQIIKSLIEADHQLAGILPKLNLSQKSRAWNDKKITAHHGIIPTKIKANIGNMSEAEFKLYNLIRRRYLAQFLPACEVDKTVILLQSGSHTLVAKGSKLIQAGWKVLFGKTLEEQDSGQLLPTLSPGKQCAILDSEIKVQQTSPPSYYTEGTLLTSMKNAARFVTDERLKQRLRETEGLGTEATRAATIQGLIDKGFLKKKGKLILATDEAYFLIDNLPVTLKDPGLTALWEQALNLIAEGKMTLANFMQKQEVFIRKLMQAAIQQGISLGNIESKKCPQCGSPMSKRKGKNGPFWGCTAYPNCRYVENISTTKNSAKRKARSPIQNVSEQIAGLRNILKESHKE